MKINISIVAFAIVNNQLVVLLEENNLPHKVLTTQDSLDEIAQNVYQNILGASLRNSYLEQLYTFGSKKSVIITYLVLVSNPSQKSSLFWIPVSKISKLLLEEKKIVTYAKKRLQWKLEYTNVAYSLLPKEFTLSELQRVYEVILEKELDKRNFRKKIISLNLLTDTKKRRKDVGYRPAKLYRFKQRKLVIVEIL